MNTHAGAEFAVTEAITPYLPFAGVVAGALIVGAFGLWNRKRGNIESRNPAVNEIWSRQAENEILLDAERKARRRLEDLLELAYRTFRGYVDRVMSDGTIHLTHAERAVYEAHVPEFHKPGDPQE